MTTFGIALDRSGSMRGEPEQACRQAWGMLADELAEVPGVRIDVATFALRATHIGASVSTLPPFPEVPVMAMPSRLAPALSLIHESWGTVATTSRGTHRPPVFVVTDGGISDYDRVAQLMDEGVARWQAQYVALYAGHRTRTLPGRLWAMHVPIHDLSRARVASFITQLMPPST